MRVKPLTPGSWIDFWFWDATDGRWEALRSQDGDVHFEVGEDLRVNHWNELWLDTWAATNAGDAVETPTNAYLHTSENASFIWDDFYAALPEARFSIGQRVSMTDISGSTVWTYDPRGRVTQDSKILSGAGTYTTSYSYDAMDRVTAITYPTGEVVNQTYNIASQLSSVAGTNTYASGMTYNALGQPRQITLGNGAVTTYDYYGSGGPSINSFRLWRTQTTKSGANLLELQYNYDSIGNVKTITDVTNSTQILTFNYDALDRLTGAATTAAGAGQYSQEFAYNPIGNFIHKNNVAHTYDALPVGTCADGTPATKPHAATSAGSNSYQYDCNGNMITRTENSATYAQTWTKENRLETVTDNTGHLTQFYYDGDGNRVKKVGYQNVAAGRTATSNGTLHWPLVVTNGDTWADSGAGDSGEFAYTDEAGLRYVQLDLGGVYTVDQVKVWHWAADGRTYHHTKTEVSADGVTWTPVFDSATSGEYPETAAGKLTTFSARPVRYVRDYLNGSTSNAGNHWVEIEVWGTATTVYIGSLLEKNISTGQVTSYYFAGPQRVAMRTFMTSPTVSTLSYFIADHLGSTSLTLDASGNKIGEMKYYPFGETRYVTGTLGTDRRYTGQREENGLGSLYDYNARMYSPYLNRWLSPDTIVPQPGNPQDLNRYSYTRNNPLKYTDPTGHDVDCGIGEPGCRRQSKNQRLPRKIMLDDIPEYEAQPGYACSPTALFILLRHAGVEDSLSHVLNKALGYLPEEGGLEPSALLDPPSCSGVCTSLQLIERIAEGYVSNGVRIKADENWSIDDIRQQLHDGLPVMVNYGGGTQGGIGHSIVLVGVDLDITNNDKTKGAIYYLDPYHGPGVKSRPLGGFEKQWGNSDFRDPLRKEGITYRPYRNWALVVAPMDQ